MEYLGQDQLWEEAWDKGKHLQSRKGSQRGGIPCDLIVRLIRCWGNTGAYADHVDCVMMAMMLLIRLSAKLDLPRLECGVRNTLVGTPKEAISIATLSNAPSEDMRDNNRS